MDLLLTRPYEDSLRTKKYIEANSSHNCIIEPLLEITPIHKNQEFDEDAIYIATSINSIRSLTLNTKNRDLKIVTVGNSSYNEAKESGFYNVISAAEETGKFGEEAIISYVLEKFLKSRKIIHLAASVTKGGIEKELKRQGYNFDKITMYKSVVKQVDSQNLQKITAMSNLNYIFFSPRTAAIFTSNIIKNNLNSTLNNRTAFCFSENVLKGLYGLDFKNIVLPDDIDNKSFLNLICSFND